MDETEGDKILSQPEKELRLRMESARIRARGCNVSGVKEGRVGERIVFCAHIDSKMGTPGALDNAGSVGLLLALADLLKDHRGKHTVELTAINGEDYYAYSGGMRYLADNKDHLERILLAVNADGAGSRGGRTTYCCFNAPDRISRAVGEAFSDRRLYAEAEPWYQSDHMMFVMNGRPAVALTSEDFHERLADTFHTAKDTIDLVDPDVLSSAALSMKDLIDILDRML